MTIHYLYRCYDADGVLLYIGCTLNPRKRHSLHNTSVKPNASRLLQRHMSSFVVDGDGYPNEEIARAAETVAIYREQPIFNTAHRCLSTVLVRQGIELYEAGLPAIDWHLFMARNDMHPSRAVRAAQERAA